MREIYTKETIKSAVKTITETAVMKKKMSAFTKVSILSIISYDIIHNNDN